MHLFLRYPKGALVGEQTAAQPFGKHTSTTCTFYSIVPGLLSNTLRHSRGVIGPLPLLMHQIPPRKNSPQKQPLRSTLRVSECEWSPFRCQRSSTYLGILPKELLFLCCHLFYLLSFIKGGGELFILILFLLLQAWPKGRALCTAKGMHIHKQQLAAEFASGISNNAQ